MNYRYTFTGCDYENILQNAQFIVPGINKIIAIYKPSVTDDIKAIMRVRPDKSEDIEPLLIIDRLDRITKLRTPQKRFEWMAEHEIGIEKDRSIIEKTEIFDELNKNILLLRFKNEFDGLHDLLLIYLNPNQGNYGLSLSDKAVASAQKSIIEYHMFNAFNSFLIINRKNREIQQRINADTQAIIQENRKLAEKLKLLENSNHENLKNLATKHCADLSVKYKKKYLLSDLAFEKIKGFKGNISHLYTIIKNAIAFAENNSLQTHPDIHYIDDWHINLTNFEVKETEEIVVHSFSDQKYANTIALLDRLENGAKIVLSKKEKLTGINVGGACNRPMKAPGITDALSNHRSKILTLFQKYPDKWEIIRKEFTPIKNLVISSLKNDQLSA
ncbi:MAG: hypothetical protein CVU00_06090 [Bacteroidetes bacterium HGW-Bacteroidetes-17]|jgi:hypothetical protein|nr:MAG: hypothetical protein CVU00_06090 [Bacteroidetes bacterium HGW-Bacteroidetes-17]